MSKNMRCLLLLTVLVAFIGCPTSNAATTDSGQNVQNDSNPITDCWNVIKKADAWIQKNLW